MGVREYDAIILGAGHNGLVLQAYLARKGLKTLSLDRGEIAGGGLRTEASPVGEGFRHNTHAFFLRGISQAPWFRELELERHGARLVTPELNVAMVLEGGESLQWWTDFERTQASFARWDARDAETLATWRKRFEGITRNILVPESMSIPVPAEERRRTLERSVEGRLLLETSSLSPVDFVRREFRHPAVQAALLFFNGLREVDLRLPGFGHHIPSLIAGDRFAEVAIGGSGRLAESLVAAVEAAGGEVRTGVEPRRIRVEGGRATGVELEGGELIRARQLVASSLSPRQTFIDLLDPAAESGGARRQASGYRYNRIAPLFGLYLDLDEAPCYRAGNADEALMVILGLDGVSQFESLVAAHEEGRIPGSRVMWGSCPTRFDPSQAPPGKHTAFLWEKLPYALKGDSANWEAEGERQADRMLEAWRTWAPNLVGSVRGRFHRTPLDIERTLPNLHRGDLLGGSFEGGQVGFGRPFVGAGNYRTEIEGLYLCGSCCHPGGNITGLPGYNAAQAVAKDLERRT